MFNLVTGFGSKFDPVGDDLENYNICLLGNKKNKDLVGTRLEYKPK